MQRFIGQSAIPTARAVATLAFLAGLCLVIPANADSSGAPGAGTAAAAPASTADAHVEARIKDLHKRLAITAAQEDAWGSVAAVMRENADTMSGLIKTRSESAKTMSAVDDVKSYAAIAQAHADGLKKFEPVFETLYNSLSDAQKKSADSMFRHHHGHHAAAKAP